MGTHFLLCSCFLVFTWFPFSRDGWDGRSRARQLGKTAVHCFNTESLAMERQDWRGSLWYFSFLHKCLKFIIGLVFFSLTIAKRAACFTVRSLFILRRRQEREMASCSVWSIRFGRDRSVSELNKT